MKQKFLLFTILIAFVACTKENLVINTPASQGDNTEIEVNIKIARADDFASTKATVKNAFANNDVVFVFFKGIAAPKYLEMKYNSSTDTWTSTAKNGLTSSDLSDAADKKMTAIYLPYGSTATVAASEGNFIFSDITYSGYFLKAELVDYTLVGGVLSGTLSMSAPALSNNSDKLIHFDISGFTSGHDYKLYQDYVKPLTFTSVSADGVLTLDEGTVGASIPGYEDGSMMSFSGILDASAVGNAVDYQFSIDDLTSSILYTRDAGTKTLSTSKYIGIGAINNAEVWNAFEYVDLGLSVRWAKCNIGASVPEEYGDYYAWGETEPYYEPGYAQEKPQAHWKEGKTAGYDWANYQWCNGSMNSLTKYNTDYRDGNNGYYDNKTVLEPEDDIAHVKWGGSWRIPTGNEEYELRSNCTWTWTSVNGIYGYFVTSNIEGYRDRSIFLPAAESRDQKTLVDPGNRHSGGYYWGSTTGTYVSYAAVSIHFYSGSVTGLEANRCLGMSVRPVCPVRLNCPQEPTYEYVDLGLSVKWATCNVGAKNPWDYGDYYAWGETEPYYESGYAQEQPQAHWKEGKTAGYTWATYKWCNGSYNTLTKYNTRSSEGTVDNKTTLDPEDDVAHVKWGGGWRMPTADELWELYCNCSWTWYSVGNSEFHGIPGYLATSKKDGYTDRSIFLPASRYRAGREIGYYGWYWSSSFSLYYNSPASISVDTDDDGPDWHDPFDERCFGCFVRPVCP